MRKNKLKISFLVGLIFLGSALISRTMATFQRAVEFDEAEIRHLLKLSKFSSGHGGQALEDSEVNYWTDGIKWFQGVTGSEAFTSIEKRDRNEFGVVAFKGNRVVVAFPGTRMTTVSDWLTDVKSQLSKPLNSYEGYNFYPLNGKNALSGFGFLQCYNNCQMPLLHRITQYCEEKSINPSELRLTLTGHSLGGALATVSSIDLLNKLFAGNNEKNSLTIITFAAPKVFNDYVRGKWNEIIGEGNLVRFVDRTDPVPGVPLFLKQAGVKRKWQRPANFKGDPTSHPIEHYEKHLHNIFINNNPYEVKRLAAQKKAEEEEAALAAQQQAAALAAQQQAAALAAQKWTWKSLWGYLIPSSYFR